MKEVEDLTIQIQSIKYEQIELCGFMTNYYYKDLNNRYLFMPSSLLTILIPQCQAKIS